MQLSLKSTCRLWREIESATTLCCPGMCSALIWMLRTALKKGMHLSRCIRITSLLDRAVIACTTAMLSQCTSTLCCDRQRGPQMAVTVVIVASFFSAMCWCSPPLPYLESNRPLVGVLNHSWDSSRVIVASCWWSLEVFCDCSPQRATGAHSSCRNGYYNHVFFMQNPPNHVKASPTECKIHCSMQSKSLHGGMLWVIRPQSAIARQNMP